MSFIICLPEALKLQGCFLFIKVQRYWYNGVSPPSLARPCITAVFRISQQLTDEWGLRLRTIQIIYLFRMIILYASILNFNVTTMAQRSDRWKTN